MCSDKTIEKIEKGEAIVISKLKLIVYLCVILATVAVSFADVRSTALSNSEWNITQDREIEKLKNDSEMISEIRYNLKNLCESAGVTYIEK